MYDLDINDGYKRIRINKDNDRIFQFNPSDINMLSRIDAGIKNIDKLTNACENIDLKADGTPYDSIVEIANAVDNVDKEIRNEVNKMFNSSDASDALFGKQSTLSMVDGLHLWESILLEIIKLVKDEVLKQQKIRKSEIDKYVKRVK